MLRGRATFEVFATLFSKAGRNRDGRIERDARVPAAGHCGDARDDRQEAVVVLFQRGAADGLNIVVPFGEPNYYRLRPTIAIPQPRRGGTDAAIDLDGFFGLHPSLAPLEPLFRQNQLAIVHAAGSPDPTRSHFDAQDFMESGTPGVKATEDGWLNRALEVAPEENASPFRAVAMGANLPRMLHGSASAIALPDLKQFKVMPQTAGMGAAVEGGFEAMYANGRSRTAWHRYGDF